MKPSTDTDHVRAAQKGDEKAFGELVAAHHRTIAGIAYSVTNTNAAVDDLVQDTFLVAWKNMETLHMPEKFTPWLCTIARNLSKNWIRSEVYRRALTKAYTEHPHETLTPTPQQHLQHTERYHQIHLMLDTISPPLREAIVLYYLEEFTIKEIAETLQITTNTAAKRLERGRKQLRKHLETNWQETLDSDPVTNKKITQKILSTLATGPALPLTAYAPNGSLAAVPTVFPATSPTLIQTLLKGAIAMSTPKNFVAGALFLLIGLAVLYPVVAHDNRPALPVEDEPVIQAIVQEAIPIPEPAPIAPEIEIAQAEIVVEPEPTPDPISSEPEVVIEEEPEEKPTTEKISGIVTDKWNKPLPGAEVFVAFGSTVPDPGPMGTRSRMYQEMGNPDNQYSAITDDTGRYTVEGHFTESGGGRVIASYNGMRNIRPFSIGAVRTNNVHDKIDLKLEFPVSFVGQLFSTDYKPVAGAFVSIVDAMKGTSFANGVGQDQDYAITNKQGIFKLGTVESVPPDIYTAIIQVRSTQGKAIFLDLPVGSQDVIPMVMQEPGSLSGNITRGDGTPAEGLWIRLDATYGKMYDMEKTEFNKMLTDRAKVEFMYAAVTDADGAYEIPEVASGMNYSITLSEPQADPEEKQYALSAEKVNVLSPEIDLGVINSNENRQWEYTILDLITIKGIVTGEPSGKPIENIHVRIFEPAFQPESSDTVTNARGEYELKISATPGSYKIGTVFDRMQPSLAEKHLSETIMLDYGDDIIKPLTAPDPATVQLRIIDQFGNPLEGGFIATMFYGEDSGLGQSNAGRTDAEGRFKWAMMPPMGTMEFDIYVPDYKSRKSQKYPGVPGVVYPEEVIVLYKTTSIEGYVFDSDGKLFGKARLDGIAYIDDETTQSFQITTDEDGYFLLKDELPATTLEIKIKKRGRQGSITPSWQSPPIQLQPDMITSLGEIPLTLPEE